jgi:hypothetical protein
MMSKRPGEAITPMFKNVQTGLAILLAIIIAGWAMMNFRRPYAVETIALELYCPDHQNTPECLIYSRLGLVYAGQQKQAAPTCQKGWHFVGYNSDGSGQCCGPGTHWNGANSNKCTHD